MSLGIALDFVEIYLGDVPWVFKGSKTTWSRDGVDGGDTAHGGLHVVLRQR